MTKAELFLRLRELPHDTEIYVITTSEPFSAKRDFDVEIVKDPSNPFLDDRVVLIKPIA